MGLHLNYELALPADLSEDDVVAHVGALREHALALPFSAVSDVVRHDARDLDGPPRVVGLGFERLEDVVHFNATLVRPRLHRASLGLAEDDERANVAVPPGLPTRVVGFAIAPGAGSEPATVALMRLHTASGATRWWWECSCKTQYASTFGDEHLVRCHASLVVLLDIAVARGLAVEVLDETGYWESRDVRELLARVDEMNRIVARFAGAFTDAMRRAGHDSRQLQGAIFEHPDFERLETRGPVPDAEP